MLRFTRISTIYPEALKIIEKKITTSKKNDYDKILKDIFSYKFGESNNITKELSKKNYKCNEIVANVDFLQQKWKDQFLTEKNNEDVIFQQISHYRSNIIYFGNYSLLNKKLIFNLRKLNHVKLIIVFHCSLITPSIKEILKLADLVITCTEGYRKELQFKIKRKVYKINHAFNLDNPGTTKRKKRKYDITFIGSLFLKSGFHKNRINLIYELLRNFKNSYIAVNFPIKNFVHLIIYLFDSKLIFSFKKTINLLNKIFYIYLKSKKPIYGKEMLKILGNSKILVNSHIENTKHAGNMRLFEGTAMGCLVLTDKKNGLKEIFCINKEIITYSTVNNLLFKINKCLKNPRMISKISTNAQKKTLKKHTYKNRSKILNNIIIENL